MQVEVNKAPAKPAFRKFREACRDHGIGNTAAYELLAAGLLKTFKLGSATYIELRQFDELPQRMVDSKAQAALDKVKAEVRKKAQARAQKRARAA